ncbi:MAG: metallophosphoesterase family protein [Alphaproteobacteria bacterium]
MFTLAYLSDPHLAPLPRPALSELMGKRLLGYLNWLRSRKGIHDRQILDALTKDLLLQNTDHIAVGGDLINLSLRDEFAHALEWLQTLGPPRKVSVVPGNHDAYVRFDYSSGIGLWEAYMKSGKEKTKTASPSKNGFPYVRRFGKIALVGLSSGIPTAPFIAAGEVGPDQCAALELILSELGKQDFYRIVMIHHPPLIGQSSARRGLRDVIELERILKKRGAELVLYGHRHFHSLDTLDTASGTASVVGVPSASSCDDRVDHLARYNLFAIWKAQGKWHCEMTGRGLRTRDGGITQLECRMLTG